MRSTPTPRSASAADRSWSSSPPGSAGSNPAATPTWWCSDTWGRIRSPSGCAARVSTSSGWGPGAATDSWTCATPARRRVMADHARDHHNRIDPIAFRIGSLAVHWYGIMYVVAFVAAYYLGARPHAVSRGIRQDHLERLTGLTILFGLIGARLYYDVQNLSLMQSPVDVIAVWNGGMAFYGAIIGGLATLVVLGRRWKLPIWVLLDAGAFFAVVGQPIRRIGNVINGDILGAPSKLPWATAYTNPDAVLQPGYYYWGELGHYIAYQPAAAYEALGTLVILLVLLAVRHRK